MLTIRGRLITPFVLGSDSSFVYGFMILDYGFGTMTATTSLDLEENLDSELFECRILSEKSIDCISDLLSANRLGTVKLRWYVVVRTLL